MLTGKDKMNILTDCLINEELRKEVGLRMPDQHFRLYAWKLHGTNDVKLIAAIDDESAARIAIRARMDHCEQSECEAMNDLSTKDYLAPIDPDMFYQGEAPLWDGEERIGALVDKV